MKLAHYLFVKLCLVILLTGCVSGLQTNQQRMFQVDSNYKAALSIAVAYKHLPLCPAAIACSKPEVVARLQDADDIAYPALQSAQACVRSPECKDADLAIRAANTAVVVLTKVTSTLQVQK